METIVSPSGTICTAQGPLKDKLLASGWRPLEQAPAAPKRAPRKSTKKE